ncbi:hypothetical protein KL771_21690 [Hyphomicrobiaceae bacterium 22]|uniref:HTH luxR-type domain-containing protein n=2 Tax=Prosthecodimorpha staleyi TaxID=2840188 RepID=A0A947D9H4_9HYPH|nr:hypothetical protein [Prosthecodimorpha staleyi]
MVETQLLAGPADLAATRHRQEYLEISPIRSRHGSPIVQECTLGRESFGYKGQGRTATPTSGLREKPGGRSSRRHGIPRRRRARTGPPDRPRPWAGQGRIRRVWRKLMSLVEAASDTPSRRLSAREADPLADLTTQQRRAIELLAEGLLNKQIAHRMGISASTAKAHISAAYRALGVTGRIGAVTLLARAGRMG